MTEAQEKLRKEMLDADLNMRYFEALASDFSSRDLAAKIFLAATSSSTVAGWYFWNDPIGHPSLSCAWKVISAIAALASIILPFMNYTKSVEWATSLKNSYSTSMREYDFIWLRRNQYNDARLISEIEKISKQESSYASTEAHFPRRNDRLLQKCQAAVIRSRNL